MPLQNKKSGLWHTVLDQPDTYEEGSASSMFLYGMAESRNLKLLDVPHVETMRTAWAGLARTIQPNGRVAGVSAGTGPLPTKFDFASSNSMTFPMSSYSSTRADMRPK